MASGSNSRDSKSNFDAMDKLSSSTLKRNPKMELCKTDLLKLLTYLEGELQAREIVIATLKAERVKQLLYQAKYGQFSLNDPFAALQRDSYGAYNPNCDEAAIKAMYNNQLSQVENLILQHRRAQQRLRQHLYDAEQQHGKVVSELEEEIRKHAQDTAQGDDVTYMLEKERERLHQEVELERQQNKKLERELKKVVQAMEQDKLRHKQIVMLLLEERKRIVAKLVDEHSKNEEMSQFLSMEKERMTDVVEGLEEESQKSLQMEADLEQQAAEFGREREQLRSCLRKEADKNRQLMEQIDLLKRELSDHPRHFSCPLQVGDGNTVHHSEAVLTVNVGDDEATSDVDSNVDSDTALRTPPTVREMTNISVVAAAAGVVVVNGNTASSAVALVPTNASHCTANPPAPPAKPTVLRTGSATASASAAITTNSSTTVSPTVPSLGESSPKLVPPRFLKSPVPSGSPNSGLTSPNSTTIVKLVHHGVTPSSSSPSSSSSSSSTSPLLALASTQQTAQPENKQLVVQSVVVSTVSSTSPSSPSAIAAVAAAATSPTPSPHVVHVSPRVSVSTSSGARVFTTTQGGKVTFHVTAPPPQPPKKPPQLAVVGGSGGGGAATTTAAAAGVGRGAPPPVPPNKPILLKKGDVAASAAVTASANKSPGSIKFGITISKGDGGCVNSSSSGGGGSSHISLSSSPSSSGGPTVITATSVPTPPSHTSNATTSPIFKETQPVMVMACSPPPSSATSLSRESLMTARMTCRQMDDDDDDSLAPELADFQQLLVSMATSSSGAGYSSTVTSSTSMSSEGPTCSSTSPVGRLSAMLDGWKLDSEGDLDKCTRKTASAAFAVSSTSKDKRGGGGVGDTRKQSDGTGICTGRGGGGSGAAAAVRNGNISGTGNRKTTNAFKPCVRKVVSPTLPKSFNHMDL